jgi:predicted membrane channel-forming protein YqfA (hemolysin III family)
MKLIYVICIVVWIATLISLFRRRDMESGKRILWIVTVLVLNVIGVLLYFLFGPRRASAPISGDAEIDPNAEPVLSGETSWNPIQGENRFPAGQGLNPKADGRVDGQADDAPPAKGSG